MDEKLPEGLATSAQIAGADLSFRTALWLPSTPAKKLAELGPEDDAPLPRVLLLSRVRRLVPHSISITSTSNSSSNNNNNTIRKRALSLSCLGESRGLYVSRRRLPFVDLRTCLGLLYS